MKDQTFLSQRAIRILVGGMLAVLTLSCGGGRGSSERDESEVPADEAVFDGHSRYSIKVYVPDEEGEYHLRELSPQNAAYEAQQRESAEGAASRADESISGQEDSLSDSDSKRFSKKKQSLTADDGEGEGVNVSPPSALAGYAYSACGQEWFAAYGGKPNVAWPLKAGGKALGSSGTAADSVIPQGSSKWASGGGSAGGSAHWYVARTEYWSTYETFGDDSAAWSCDSVLAMQSAFLCTAEKLLDIATASSTVVLRDAHHGDVYVPPQSSEDRFLVRQLAFETLGAYAQISAQSVGTYDKSCGLKLGETLGASGTFTQTVANWVLDSGQAVPFVGLTRPAIGLPLSDPQEPVVQTSLEKRAELYVQHHGRALDLLNALMRATTNSAIGQAERLRAEGGITAMWGMSSGGPGTIEELPNSLRGAAATLLGRLETDDITTAGPRQDDRHPDPACSGKVRLIDSSNEQDILDVQAATLRARAADEAPATLRQQRAQAILERLGLLLHPANAAAAPLKAIVKEQMAIADAFHAGLGNNVTELTFEQGDEPSHLSAILEERGGTYDALLSDLTEEDIRFALKTNLSLFVQLAGGGVREYPVASISVNSGTGGLYNRESLMGPNLLAVGAANTRGLISTSQTRLTGMPRKLLVGDSFPRLAPATTASQCPLDHFTGIDPYQDVASLGLSIYQSASQVGSEGAFLHTPILRRLETEYLSTHAPDGITDVTLGPDIFYNVPGKWGLGLRGKAELAGVSAMADLPIEVLFGFPWQAECLAGLRSTCGTSAFNLLPKVASPMASLKDQFYRLYDPVGVSTLSNGQGIANNKSLLYVVLKPREGKPGRILAAIRPSENIRGAAVSELQRKQLNRLFEVSSRTYSGDRCLEGVSSGELVGSCIEGIDKDQYVPLSNELTSSSGGVAEDSWKHYLGLATEAAAHADELGQQIIELGTTRDMRAEGAAEELAAICGGVPDPAQLELDNGTVMSEEDSEFNACVAPETTDIVFFQGTKVTIDADRDGYKQIVKDQTNCGSACGDPEMVGLGMDAPPAAYRPPGIPGCDAFLGTGGGINIGVRKFKDNAPLDRAWFRESTQKDHYSFAALAAAVTKYQFMENMDGTWGVYVNGLEPLFAGSHVGSGTLTRTKAQFEAGPYSGFPLCERVIVEEDEENDFPGYARGEGCSALALSAAAALGYDSHDAIAVNQFKTGDPSALKHGGHLSDAEWVALELRLRPVVEGGLWHMARLTGNLPRGLFSLVIPAYNFGPYEGETNTDMEWPALYSKAHYELVDEVTSKYRLHEDGYFYGTDGRNMPSLVHQPGWQLQYKLGRPQQPRINYYSRAHTDLGGNGSLVEDKYLALGPVPNESKFFESMSNYDPASHFESVVLEQWLLDVTTGDETTAEAAFDATAQALNWGNAPRGVDLLQDGVLKSLVVRRKGGCHEGEKRDKDRNDGADPDLIYGKMADLLPYEGQFTANDVVLWPTKGDDTRETENDGWVFHHVLADKGTDFDAAGSCSGGVSQTVCTAGNGEWHDVEEDDSYNMFKQYNDCREDAFEYALPLVSSSVWPPPQRVHMYVDPGPDGMSAVLGMGLLSCLADGSSAGTSLEVPIITNPRQIPSMRQWIETQSDILADMQKKMFVKDVPDEVIGYFNGEGVHGAVGGGQTSDQMLAMAQAFKQIHSGFSSVYTGVRGMGDAVRTAELMLSSAEIQRDLDRSNLAVQRINTIGRMVSSLVTAASSAVAAGLSAATSGADVASNAGQAAASAVDAVTAGLTLNEIGKQQASTGEQYENSIDMALQGMTEGVQRGMEQSDQGMTQIQTATLEVLRVQNTLKGLQDQATYQAAKAMGADGIDLDGNGTIDQELPVNIVYRRQFDVLKRRYEKALESAKRYAFLAKLSIEQRLGVRMESLNEEIGPLAPPAQWQNKVCDATGIDYASLRTLKPELVPGEDSAIDENSILDDFVDQYVGDYVRQLEEFVEYYNIEYPFREDDDSAVLSLRDDLVYGNGACRREAKNLLYHSDALGSRNATATVSEAPERSLEGWKQTQCVAEVQGEDTVTGSCIDVNDKVERTIAGNIGSETYNTVIGLPYETSSGSTAQAGLLAAPPLALGVTLISPRPMATETFASVEPGELEKELAQAKTSILPDNAVYQTVFMEKGAFYRLSWLDQSRTALGALTDDPTKYRVMVMNEEGTPIFLQELNAETDDEWSDRHSFEVNCTEDGYYHVVFEPLFDRTFDDGDETTNQALALSSVQLEYFEVDGPADYEATTGTRMITKMDCGAGNGQLFRDSFVRRCYQGDCYYELTKPIQLTDNDIDGGRWDLPGIAEQNYNYRHRTLAVNVVGTGVLDCDGANPGCFSNGFVEYDLVHTAYNTALRDYGGEPRCFNFGEAEIKHGKALATERYLGIPMSSEDESLIGGEDFTKGAFHGRPLTGMYTLRIYESPQMRWENVEDIQLVLNYRYWSRVKRNPN